MTKLDSRCAEAVELARTALSEACGRAEVGEHLGVELGGKKVAIHNFACVSAGYRGWRWSVVVTRAPKQKHVTVSEIVLLPGDEAIMAPEWVPYRERIQPGDLSPGDVLPPEDDDERLVPAFSGAEGAPDPKAVKQVADELGLGRSEVLSLVGRDQAAERWYESHGPETALAQGAPGECGDCGFLVRLAGPLSTTFGVCANAFANDDGHVVSFDHGCGAHSKARLSRKQQAPPLPDPTFDDWHSVRLDAF